MLLKTRPTKFLWAGATAAAFELGLFAFLVSFGVYPVVAQSISFCGGVIISFALNMFWVFDAKSKTKTRFVAYGTLAAINLLISSGIMQLLYSRGMDETVAKIAIMALVALWNYFLFSKVIFRELSK